MAISRLCIELRTANSCDPDDLIRWKLDSNPPGHGTEPAAVGGHTPGDTPERMGHSGAVQRKP